MKKVLSTAAIVAFVFVSIGFAFAGDNAADKACKVSLEVSGMTCGAGCPGKVSKALMAVKGVKSVKVDYEQKNADVQAASAVWVNAGPAFGIIVRIGSLDERFLQNILGAVADVSLP